MVHAVCIQGFAFVCREDKTVWLGERQDRKIGFFKSEHVKEVLGYDIMDGKLVNSFLITKLIYPVASVYKSSLSDQDGYVSTKIKTAKRGTNASKVREVSQTVQEVLCTVKVGSIVQYWTSNDLFYRPLIINTCPFFIRSICTTKDSSRGSRSRTCLPKSAAEWKGESLPWSHNATWLGQGGQNKSQKISFGNAFQPTGREYGWS